MELTKTPIVTVCNCDGCPASYGAATGGAASVVATGVVVTVGAPVVVGGIVVIGAGLVGGYIGSTVYDSIVPPGVE